MDDIVLPGAFCAALSPVLLVAASLCWLVSCDFPDVPSSVLLDAASLCCLVSC